MIKGTRQYQLPVTRISRCYHLRSMLLQYLQFVCRLCVEDTRLTVNGCGHHRLVVQRMKLGSHHLGRVAIQCAQTLTATGGPDFRGAIEGAGDDLVAACIRRVGVSCSKVESDLPARCIECHREDHIVVTRENVLYLCIACANHMACAIVAPRQAALAAAIEADIGQRQNV